MKGKSLRYWLIISLSLNAILVALIFYLNYVTTENKVEEVLVNQGLVVVLSVTCSIIASVIFAWLTDGLSKKDTSSLINQIVSRTTSENAKQLQEQFNQVNTAEMVDQITSTITAQNAEQIKQQFTSLTHIKNLKCLQYAPSYIYEGSRFPHVEFNKFINDKISSTGQYIYFGDKARFLAKRLKYDIDSPNPKLKIWVVLPNLTDDSIFEARKNTLARMNRKLQRALTLNEQLLEEKLDIIRSIYWLNELKNKYDITILLHNEIPMFRFEVTDDTLVLSFISQLIDGNYYPTTLVYEKDPLLRESMLEYFESIKMRSIPLKDEQLTKAALINLGKKLVNADFSERDLIESELVIGQERS